MRVESSLKATAMVWPMLAAARAGVTTVVGGFWKSSPGVWRSQAEGS
jgi:hypothetical protein